MERNTKKKQKRKPKFVVDEDSLFVVDETDKTFKNVNFKVAHDLTGKPAAPDIEVYRKSNECDRHVFTRNFKDYRKFPKKIKDVGVVGYSESNTGKTMRNVRMLFKTYGHEEFYGRCFYIDDEGIKIKKDLSQSH